MLASYLQNNIRLFYNHHKGAMALPEIRNNVIALLFIGKGVTP